MNTIGRDFSHEFIFQSSRSSGPGGQNVNKVRSKVELRFNVADSQLLNEEEKALVFEKLANKINNQQELVLVSQKDRSQFQNKETVIEKFYSLLDKVLTPPKRRYKTKPTRSSVEKRLESKRVLSEIKARRRGVGL
jgi:ribosome-associated protein